ncbi:MAG: CRISPR-associated protein Cas4 [Phycisphaeraceae bacterium]
MPKHFAESDLLPISALQHLIYCPRQCALIHNERLWAENRLTVEGRLLHDKAHDASRDESRPGVRIARGLALRSLRWGLAGYADVVEFPLDEDGSTAGPPVPIEYKRGRPKAHDADAVQLCAQALCLEEMLGLAGDEHGGAIATGCLFYGKTRRRKTIAFDATLRRTTTDCIERLHTMIDDGTTPPAVYGKRKCDHCSLRTLCMPEVLGPRRSAARTFDRLLHAAGDER